MYPCIVVLYICYHPKHKMKTNIIIIKMFLTFGENLYKYRAWLFSNWAFNLNDNRLFDVDSRYLCWLNILAFTPWWCLVFAYLPHACMTCSSLGHISKVLYKGKHDFQGLRVVKLVLNRNFIQTSACCPGLNNMSLSWIWFQSSSHFIKLMAQTSYHSWIFNASNVKK